MKLVYLMVLVCLGYFLVVVPLSSVKADRDDSDSESSSSDDSDEQRPPASRPRPPARSIPHVFFHDEDYDDDIVDMNDLFDDDIEMGDAMIVLPISWANLTLDDVNDAVEACRTLGCRQYEACVISDDGDPACQCPTASVCDSLEDQLICASDGQTYDNRCLLRVDECAANRLMRVLHRGPCRQGNASARRGSRVRIPARRQNTIDA